MGWELKGLRMTVSGSDAEDVHAVCPCPDLTMVSEARKRLLVLFAGNAATRKRWRDSENDKGDWQDVCMALTSHFCCTVTESVKDGLSISDADALKTMHEARLKRVDFVASLKVRGAIDEIAEVFRSIPPDAEEKVWLPGETAISICIKHLGEDFQAKNPWSGSLAGE